MVSYPRDCLPAMDIAHAHPIDGPTPSTDDQFDAAVARIAAAQYGVFGFHQLDGLPCSDDRRRHRLLTGRWEMPYDRVYRIAGVPPSWRGDLLAACLAGGPRAVGSHRSAARVHRIPGPDATLPEITCPRWRRARHGGLIVHETTTLGPADITVVDNIPVTTVERTIFDLAAVRSRTVVEMAIDSALRQELTTVDRLLTMLRRVGKRGRRGTRVVRGLLEELDADYVPTESERELMLLRVLRAHGLPEPDRQTVIRSRSGDFIARVDLAYPHLRIAMEYDSYQHHVGKRAIVRDNRRRNAITTNEWILLVATAEDVRWGRGSAFVIEVRSAIESQTRKLASQDRL